VTGSKSKRSSTLSQGILLLLAACCSLLLAGCGFHLRGSVTEGVQLPPTFLAGQAGPLQREVRHYLGISEAPLVERQKDAKLVIRLIGEDIQRRVLSVGSTGKVEEYEVHYAATYSVERANGEIVIPREILDQQRSYTYSETEVLAKDVEQERLVQDMRRDVVRQMMRRLQSVLAKTP
jgi:LPS-assembly lipoprotein